MNLSSSPMLRNAVEAICYAHAGSNYNDDRLVRQSQMSYGKVLSGLMSTLKGSPQKSQPMVIIPSILLLCIYDDPIPHQDQDSNGWRAHYWGVHDYLRAIGPSSFDPNSAFDRLVFMNLRTPTTFLGISRRKSIILSDPEWQALSDKIGSGVKPIGGLNKRAMRLPQLLERCDALLADPDSDDTEQLLSDLLRLRSDFLYWSVHESSFSGKSGKSYDVVNITQVGSFDLNIEEHAVLRSTQTFTTFYNFLSYRLVEDMTGFWMFCLILDCTILRILHFLPQAEIHIEPKTREEILRDADNRARYLCRSVYFISKTNSQGIAGYMDTIVALAENFFREVEAEQELGWCQAVRCATKRRVKRLQTFQARTLCRMGYMADELGAAANFCTRNKT